MEQILQRSDHQSRRGRKGHVKQMPGRCTEGTGDPCHDAVTAVLIQVLPPTLGGGVVVGARVDDPSGALDVFGEVRVVRLSIEGELKHLHPGQGESIPQGLHIRCDHAEILSNQRQ